MFFFCSLRGSQLVMWASLAADVPPNPAIIMIFSFVLLRVSLAN